MPAFIPTTIVLSNMDQNKKFNTLKEFEFLYNMRDQTMLFLELMPNNEGKAETLLCMIEMMMDSLREKLGISDEKFAGLS